MNRETLLSVIIPVYNVEEYLEECLNSIIDQSIGIKNIEVIIINDGKIDFEVMRKQRYSIDDLYTQIRQLGIESVTLIRWAILENKETGEKLWPSYPFASWKKNRDLKAFCWCAARISGRGKPAANIWT